MLGNLKEFEVWEGDHYKLVKSFDTVTEAKRESNRLNQIHNRDYFVRKNDPDGSKKTCVGPKGRDGLYIMEDE
ncbi:hypothetical protein F1737_08940 [Methanoplanus sp. FWC-SCC4]|uniref:Uncharacterized protein n=1 Tax=Methanochimaera problematica TaxID=2609417 RepID=A0AA97FCB5_9EURY|nr:hypothetical protein [Methanoplanus sp. FWC-SCC4]WOF16805.1 hypothetical protein F1737_08940 [Methanoplanus sp. FWC-SCC4]